jgi:hypothetical protein
VREPYAHDAVVSLPVGADEAAPGAAVTVELCGHWRHHPPCPVAPHHTRARREGEDLHLRVLFAAEPEREMEVRRRIDAAPAAGRVAGPDGGATRWRLRCSAAGTVDPDEADHASRLVSDG